MVAFFLATTFFFFATFFLACVGRVPVLLARGNSADYDFTLDEAFAYRDNAVEFQSSGSRYAMWAGDANADGNVQALDFNEYLGQTLSGATGYRSGDLNMDGNVQALDFNLYLANTLAGASSQVP